MISDKNNERAIEVIKTQDGSSSLYIPELDETYHSRHGAVQEAKHVFIEMGLIPSLEKFDKLNVFEMGLGTGLNALLTALHSQNEKKNIEYNGLEKFPVAPELIDQLSYRDIESQIFDKIHSSPWNEKAELSDHFTLHKISGDIKKINLAPHHFHLVYYDAFGPRAQNEMWDPRIFKKLFDSLVSGGLFVTYCAKGQVRRDLESIGFIVERLPGPPGKREMLRGQKP